MADITKLSNKELLRLRTQPSPAKRKRIVAPPPGMFDPRRPLPPPELVEGPPVGPTRLQRAAPSALQTVGGLGLGIPGGVIGGPKVAAVTGAVGGTFGRGLGRLAQLTAEQRAKRPETERQRVLENILGFTPAGPIADIARLSPERRKILGKEVLKTGAIEAALVPISLGVSRLFKNIGQGALRGLLGPRVAERGFARGWKRLLNPAFYKQRIPKQVAQKVGRFFPRLNRTTGGAIDNLLKSPKYKNVTVQLAGLKDKIRTILPAGVSIDDFDVSPAQKKLLARETQKILGLGGRSRTLRNVWLARRNLDNVIKSHSWKPESMDYLRKLRTILNQPIKGAGDDIAEAFGRYHFVQLAEDEVGSAFTVLQGEAEVFAPKTERFVSTLLSTKKDETIRLLQTLDALQVAPDRVIEDVLDIAAAESIEKGISFGPWSRIVTGMLSITKTGARIGGFAQRPTVVGLKTAIGRAVPVGISELTREQQIPRRPISPMP